MSEVRKHLKVDVPSELRQLAEVFKQAGHVLYLVGGAVRDAVMGSEPKDWDVATDATPDQVRPVLLQHGYTVLEVGAAFGVLAVVLPPPLEKLEIATFREDMSAGRHPTVRFASIKEDVQRRDLTINALFYDMATQEVVDLVGGLRDIEAGVVRTVGDPRDRFAEDKLRKLRALRFAGRFGFELSVRTLNAICDDSDLTGVSPERVHDELVKAVSTARRPSHLMELMDAAGMWPRVLPGLKVSTSLDTLVSTRGIDTNDPVLALALLLDAEHDHAAVTKRLAALKYSSEEVTQVAFLLRFRMFSLDHDSAYHLRKAFQASGMTVDRLTQYFLARGMPSRDLFQAFAGYLGTPPVGGDALLAQGYSGKALGVELQRQERELFCGLMEG